MRASYPRTIPAQAVFRLAGLAFSALAAGCASYPAPTEGLAAARVTLAEVRTTAPYGFVPREAARAEGKIALGERWIAAGDHKPARWLMEQAQVDAELAAMKAASARARSVAHQARR